MNVLEFAQTSSAIAGIAMILIGSRRLKLYLRAAVRGCPRRSLCPKNI